MFGFRVYNLIHHRMVIYFKQYLIQKMKLVMEIFLYKILSSVVPVRFGSGSVPYGFS